jgi:hypothetical protein
MAESKRAKLERLQKQRTELQVQLAQVAVKRETFHKTNDGSMYHFYSMRNPKHNLSRSNMQSQIRNLESKISGYTAKIDKLKQEVYN